MIAPWQSVVHGCGNGQGHARAALRQRRSRRLPRDVPRRRRARVPPVRRALRGVENLREWRSNYPASTKVDFREIRGGADVWVAELSISYDDGPWSFGVSILEFRGDKIARESIYVAEGWEAPEWRAGWRSAP
jgi:hypothetical protein